MDSLGKSDDDFADKLTKWADIIRKTFRDGGIDEIIATRRLVHIVKAYAVFGDRMKAILPQSLQLLHWQDIASYGPLIRSSFLIAATASLAAQLLVLAWSYTL